MDVFIGRYLPCSLIEGLSIAWLLQIRLARWSARPRSPDYPVLGFKFTPLHFASIMGSGEQIQIFLLESCYRLCLQSCLFNILVNIFHTDHTFSISIKSFIITPAWLMFVFHLKYSSETYHKLSILCFILEFAYLNPQILFSWWRTQFIFVGNQEECKGKEMFVYLTGSITSIGMFYRLWAKCRYWQNTLSEINNRYGTGG